MKKLFSLLIFLFLATNLFAQKPELVVQMGHTEIITSVAYSPNGKYALSGSWDNTLKLWDINTGKEIRTFTGHNQWVYSVTFSPDGKYALSGSNDHTLKLWDIKSDKEIRTFTGHLAWVNSVCFSPDGKYALSGSWDKTLKLWDINTGVEIKTFTGHSWNVKSVCFSPDGKYALSGSGDKTVKLWDINTGKEIRTFTGHSGDVNSVCFFPGGKYALSGSDDNTFKLWDINTGMEIRTFKEYRAWVKSVCFSPNGKYVLSGNSDNTLKLWDINTVKEIRTFTGHSDRVNSVCFSPDGKYVLSGSDDKTLKLWDISTGKEIKTFTGHSLNVNSICFSTNGKYLLGSFDKTLKLWDINTSKEIRTFKGHTDWITSVTFSPDGKYALSGSGDETLKLWDINTGKEIRAFTGHKYWVCSVTFSPDGKYALSGSMDKTLKLWDISTGKEIKTFTGHSSWVESVTFSLDGKYIASGSWDGKIKLWDIEIGKELASLISLDSTDWAVATPEGYFDASPGGMKNLHYVQGLDILPLESFIQEFHVPGLLAKVISGDFKPKENSKVDFNKPIDLPPGVEIISPKIGDIFKTDEITITANIFDRGGGIDKILVSVNGSTNSEVSIDKSIKPTENKNKITKTFNVKLAPGENKIKVIAFNKNGTATSFPPEITVTLESQKKDYDLYIISIGINDYENPSYKLNYCVSDAKEITSSLEKRGGYIFKNIYKKELYNSDATKDKLLDVIDFVAKNSRPEDVFIFYYSGHGAINTGKDNDFYLVMHNVQRTSGDYEELSKNGVSAKMLKDLCLKINAQKKIFILDACHSAAVGIAFNKGNEEDEAFKMLAYGSGTILLTASSVNEYAKECQELKHGVFTYALLEGLNCSSEISYSGNLITAGTLSDYAVRRVEKLIEKYKLTRQVPNSFSYEVKMFPIGICK